MKKPIRESKISRNFDDDWRNDMMTRDKEEIVFMLKIIGKENMRLRRELEEKDTIPVHRKEEKEK